MVEIRNAALSDAEAIAAIWNPIIRDTAITFWPTERSPEEIAAIIRLRQQTGRGFLVAAQDGAVIGFASYDQFRAGLGYDHSMEHTIHIAPQARGLGLGAALLRRLEDHARTNGARIMVAGITGSNSVSIDFHARMGYARWGLVPNAGWKFGQWHDLVLMGHDLTN